MKRDMELVREILLAVEEKGGDPRGFFQLTIANREADFVSYHVMLMKEAGLIHATNLSSSSGFSWAPTSLTWAGHEFLDAARNDTVWNKTMITLKDQAASAPFEVVKALLIQTCKTFFGLG